MAYTPTPAVVEDAAIAGGETLTPVAYVRRDVPSTDTSANGDAAMPSVDNENSTWVAPKKKLIEVTGDLANFTTSTPNYSVGDVIGTAPVTLSGIASAAGRLAVINTAIFIDQADVLGALDVYLYNASYANQTDNAAIAITDAEGLTCQGRISFPGLDDMGGHRMGIVTNLGLVVKTNASANLFALFVARTSGFVIAAGTHRLILKVEQQ